jgi:hypothetical protein
MIGRWKGRYRISGPAGSAVEHNGCYRQQFWQESLVQGFITILVEGACQQDDNNNHQDDHAPDHNKTGLASFSLQARLVLLGGNGFFSIFSHKGLSQGFAGERQKRQVASAFDGARKLALVFRTCTGLAAGADPAVF